MTAVFQLIADEGVKRLGDLKTNGAAIQPGDLVQLDSSGSTASLGDASNVFGIAFGHRYSVYTPTTKVFATDEPLTVLWGTGEALISVDFFSSGSLPAAKDTLYGAASGLWATSGSVKVGDVIGLQAMIMPTGGTGESQSLAHVRFNIEP